MFHKQKNEHYQDVITTKYSKLVNNSIRHKD